jgi:predicted phosphodiesterase
MDTPSHPFTVFSDLRLATQTVPGVFAADADLAACLTQLYAPEDTLVLAGDTFDLRVPPDGQTVLPLFAPEQVAERISLILDTHPETAAALQTWAKAGQLVIIAGDCDAELALAPVRDAVEDRLGHVRWVVGGEAWVHPFGDLTLRCMHGDLLDPWNCVDYGSLLRAARCHSRAIPADGFYQRSAGTYFMRTFVASHAEKRPELWALWPAGPSTFELLDRVLDAEAAEALQMFRDGLAPRFRRSAVQEKARALGGVLPENLTMNARIEAHGFVDALLRRQATQQRDFRADLALLASRQTDVLIHGHTGIAAAWVAPDSGALVLSPGSWAPTVDFAQIAAAPGVFEASTPAVPLRRAQGFIRVIHEAGRVTAGGWCWTGKASIPQRVWSRGPLGWRTEP